MADIVYKTVEFPSGFVGVPYEAGIAFTGAATAVTAGGVNSGALPDGLVVNAADHVRITGTPTAAGLFTFTLTLTDTAGAVVSGTYTILISPGGSQPIQDRTLGDQMETQWPSEF